MGKLTAKAVKKAAPRDKEYNNKTCLSMFFFTTPHLLPSYPLAHTINRVKNPHSGYSFRALNNVDVLNYAMPGARMNPLYHGLPTGSTGLSRHKCYILAVAALLLLSFSKIYAVISERNNRFGI